MNMIFLKVVPQGCVRTTVLWGKMSTGPKIKVTELTTEQMKFVLYDCDLRYLIKVIYIIP